MGKLRPDQTRSRLGRYLKKWLTRNVRPLVARLLLSMMCRTCFCPSCLADPMHQEDHHRNEDARARDNLHRAFGHANIDGARVGDGPSNPHVIPSSI
ncbi:hypothetical protein ZOSMA_104G00320 [Zostera marina]|uniref:Uncharacterized protein n=1 Tax=Zostera marina TaxID=29655 RepID=A0A0K9Q524_ZOSMR|nr:hypothetical protein ZOSMA_104G00320 [Zostera marina]